jgi:hypothetical protein
MPQGPPTMVRIWWVHWRLLVAPPAPNSDNQAVLPLIWQSWRQTNHTQLRNGNNSASQWARERQCLQPLSWQRKHQLHIIMAIRMRIPSSMAISPERMSSEEFLMTMVNNLIERSQVRRMLDLIFLTRRRSETHSTDHSFQKERRRLIQRWR